MRNIWRKQLKSKETSVFDTLSFSQKEYIVNKYLTDAFIQDVSGFKPVTKKIEKNEKIDIPKAIRKECKENEDIFILSMDKNFAFLLKRKEEVITRVLGEGTMNPVEQQKDVVYFDCFALCWSTEKKEKPIPKLENLKQYGFPSHFVETEYEIKKCISES